ncbi:MAG: hypothetical protein AB7P17_07030 [Nitrospirales bacterium]|nr:hypothetical protein [Nitrospirales bacterium]
MFHSTCFLYTVPGSSLKILALLICLGGAIMLAEGCVKRPDWQPTPGVAPKGIEFHWILS